jgi:hypothetical protein
MSRHIISRSAVVVILSGFLFTSGCEMMQRFSGDNGKLEGIIHIGPICPVETIPPDPACLPTAETYKAYPVGIWSENGRRKLMELSPSLDGSYMAVLAPGTYKVILEKAQGGQGGSTLPVVITIMPNQSTVLQIDIDTGIR